MSIKSVIPGSWKAYAKELLGICRVERQVDHWRSSCQAIELALKQLEERITILESVAGFAKNIDLVRFDDFFYFVYEDDVPRYSNPPETWRQHIKLSPTEISSLVADARTSDARRKLHETDAVARAIWSLAKTGKPVNLIYVGCSYGFHLMKVADFIQKLELNCRIVAFDPGIAGTLTAPTLRLNQLHNIEFFNIAASCANSHAIMQHIVGHSEDNKLVNIVDSPLRISRLVETVTLDSFCAQHRIAGPTVLVIDTQGSEPDVIAGAAQFLESNACVIVSEFTPWALNARMLAQDYLALLGAYGDVYNLGVVEHQAEKIDGAEASALRTDATGATMPSLLREKVTVADREGFSARILSQPPHWTDVLVIPGNHDLGGLVAADFNAENVQTSPSGMAA